MKVVIMVHMISSLECRGNIRSLIYVDYAPMKTCVQGPFHSEITPNLRTSSSNFFSISPKLGGIWKVNEP